MAQSVIMPRQGQSVESCIITTWHKKVGDPVNEGDLLFSYETDKSAFDEPSPATGTVLAQLAAEGDVVPCLEVVCIIGQAGENIDALVKKDAPAAEEAKPAEAAEEAKPAEAAPTADAPKCEGGRVKISPRAKNLALKTGADLAAATPTGPNGRLIERDVQAVLDKGCTVTTAAVEAFLRGEVIAKAEAPAAAPIAAAAPAAPAAPAAAGAEYEEAPLTNVRRTIARSMHASLSEMAQLTLNTTFDATDLLAYREKLKASAEALGIGKITLNDMVLWAASRILPKYPDINANLVDDKMRRFRHANIGMAVDTDRGLLVPVIAHADEMSLAELAAATKVAAAKARDAKLLPDEMKGGSFTVSNLGSLGIESFTPVINPPQTAILGVCTTTTRLRADGTTYQAMGLSLTFDHRAVDGAPAARFLHELAAALENFSVLLAK